MLRSDDTGQCGGAGQLQFYRSATTDRNGKLGKNCKKVVQKYFGKFFFLRGRQWKKAQSSVMRVVTCNTSKAVKIFPVLSVSFDCHLLPVTWTFGWIPSRRISFPTTFFLAQLLSAAL